MSTTPDTISTKHDNVSSMLSKVLVKPQAPIHEVDFALIRQENQTAMHTLKKDGETPLAFKKRLFTYLPKYLRSRIYSMKPRKIYFSFVTIDDQNTSSSSLHEIPKAFYVPFLKEGNQFIDNTVNEVSEIINECEDGSFAGLFIKFEHKKFTQ